MLYTTHYQTPIGKIVLASEGDYLTGLWIKQQKYFMDTLRGDITEKKELSIFNTTKNWLDCYFNGQNKSISDLPLAPKGGTFRQTVWKILCDIPFGQVMTYGEIAQKTASLIGKKTMSAQAIGGAIGHNPIAIIIPCHRVIGKKGNLTGYAGGIDIKIKLLQLEGVDMSCLFKPKKGTAL